MEQMIKNIQDIEKELNSQSSRKGKPNKFNYSSTLNESYRWLKESNKLDCQTHLTPLLYNKIIHMVNDSLRDSFIQGNSICFPRGMGKLELAYHKLTPNKKHTYLGNNLPIDWKATRELWVENKEARNKKTLIRHSNRIMYRIIYNKDKTAYTNSSVYEFSPCRLLQRGIAHKAKRNEIDSIIYNLD